MFEINLNFNGPFNIEEIESYPLNGRRDIEGLYLWTVKQSNSNNYLIHYIGESSKIIRRQSEHLTEVLGLNYGIYDPDSLRNGKLIKLWDGMWRDKSKSRIKNCMIKYPEITGKVLEYLKIIDVFIAEVEIETNVRRHCEAIIGNYLRTNGMQFKSIYPDDNRVILRKNMEKFKLKIECKNVLGLYKEIVFGMQ